jgi:hypothetical protein
MNNLGDDMPPGKQHPKWDHKLYGMHCISKAKAGDAENLLRYVNCIQYVSTYTVYGEPPPCAPPSPYNPD